MTPDARSKADTDRFEIVFVCTGNRARSAFAEAVLRRRVLPAQASVRSVGTQDTGGMPVLPQAARAAADFGVDLSDHRARVLVPGSLATADLVIGFEPQHLAAAVIEAKAPLERVFSIVELAELLDRLEGDEPLEPAEALERAHGRRRASDLLSTQAIADPLGGSDRVFRRTFETIDRLVERIARRLFEGAPTAR